jgi:hypothetical protein
MTFSPREVAADVYSAAIGAGMSSVLGADMDEVRAARIGACDRAERAINAALAGPERRFFVEPDDARLRRWRLQLQRRRDALQPT